MYRLIENETIFIDVCTSSLIRQNGGIQEWETKKQKFCTDITLVSVISQYYIWIKLDTQKRQVYITFTGFHVSCKMCYFNYKKENKSDNSIKKTDIS